MNELRNLVLSGRESLLLRDAERRSRALPDDRRDDVRALTAAALDHLDAATSIVGPSRTATRTLLREAVVLLLCAHARAAGRSVDDVRRAPLATVERHPELGGTDLVAALERDPSSRTALADDVDALSNAAALLVAGLEPRSPREVGTARRLRLAVLAGALLAAAVLALGTRPRSPNVALRHPVTASGLDPRSPDPAALVDGEPFGAFGVRTALDRSPWVMVDLGSVYAIDEVVVYHRGDGNVDDGLPLVVEASLDAQAFSALGRRAERFTQDEPFRLDAHRARGRYVRVRLDRPGYLALTEIEVHGLR